jgi:predicted nucleic acid-binding protein
LGLFIASDALTKAALAAINNGYVIHAPGLWTLEVSNALLALLRRRKLSQMEFEDAVNNISAIPMELDTAFLTSTFTSLLPLAKQHQLSVYDASYLELALRKSLPLACRDSALTAAAIAAGVQIRQP